MTPLPDYLQGFTNREDQIAAFDALWEDNARWTLAFSGVSGIGKSHLIEYLIETRCKPQNVHPEKIDFDGVVALEDIPFTFSRLLPTQARQAFDQTARALRQAHEQAIGELNRSVPSSVTIEQRAEGGGTIKDSAATIDVQYAERRRDLSLLFFTQLARLATEHAAALGATRALFILDTYEKFADNNQDEIIGRLWGFLRQAAEQANGLRVLVAGREQLPYRPLARFTRDEPLGDFDAATSETFLKQRGVNDPALRHAAFDLARGHPLTTRMFAEAHYEAQRAGRPISLAELKEGARARSRDEWFYDLILSRLPEPERTAATYAPLLRHFNRAVLNHALAVEMDENVFRRFAKRSFTKRVGEGTYKFHEAARNVQRAYLYASGDARVAVLHQRAAEFYSNPMDVSAARDWLYHSLIAAPQTVFEKWEQELGQAAFVYEHEWWNELLEAIETPLAQQSLKPEQHAEVLYERMRWHYVHLEDLAEGLRKGQAALELYHNVGSRVGEANTLRAIGDVQQFRKDNDAALRSYEQALKLYREVGARVGEANTLQAIGDVQKFRDDNDAALRSYEQALKLYREVGERVGEANTLQAIGDVQKFRADNDAALTSYEQALKLYREVGERVGEANTRKAIGDVQRFRADNDAALTSYEQALKLFREVGARLGEANTLQAIGDVQKFRDDNDAALTSYEQALKLFREVGARLGEANTLQAIGDVQKFRDDNDAALRSYEQALKLYREVGERVGEANTLQAIGDVQQFRADNDAALTSYEQALGLFRDVGDRLGEANTRKAIGDVQGFRKDNDAALTSYEQALKLYREVGDRLGEANTLAAQGQLFLAEDPKRADELLEQAIGLFIQIGDRYSVPAKIGNYGWALLRLNQAERAQTFFSRAAELFEQIGMANFAIQCRTMVSRIEAGKILTNADALYKEKNYEQAAAEFRRGIESEPSARAWNGLGNSLESVERYEEAIDAYSHAIQLDSEAVHLYRNRANILLELNRLQEAEQDIARAVELDPENYYTHARQGYLAIAQAEFAGAIPHFEFAAAKEDKAEWKFGVGLAKFGAGDVDAAKAIIADASTQSDDDDKKSFRKWLERIVKIKPELADAARTLL